MSQEDLMIPVSQPGSDRNTQELLFPPSRFLHAHAQAREQKTCCGRVA